MDERMRQTLEESNERHMADPSVSFEQYRCARYQQLSYYVAGRRTVYLDTKYWIWLRNPKRCPFPKAVEQLSDVLRAAIAARKILCPLSYPAFLEPECGSTRLSCGKARRR